MGVNQNIRIQGNHGRKLGSLISSMARFIASGDTWFLGSPEVTNFNRKGSGSLSSSFSKAEMTSERKVILRSAIRSFSRSIKESGKSIVVLMHKSIILNMPFMQMGQKLTRVSETLARCPEWSVTRRDVSRPRSSPAHEILWEPYGS